MLIAVRWLMVLCLMVSIGLHTAVIQSAAWVGMAVSYSLEKGSLVEGLSDTLDGEHPCPLCLLAKKTEGKPAQKDAAPAEGQFKLHLALCERPTLIFLPPVPPDYTIFSSGPAPVLPQMPATTASPRLRGLNALDFPLRRGLEPKHSHTAGPQSLTVMPS